MIQRTSLLALAACLSLMAAGAAYLKEDNVGADMTASAQSLLKSLSPEQRAKASMQYSDPKRLEWHFIPKAERKGLQLREMDEPQRKLAHALLDSCLSQVGYKKASTIMDLEKILHKLEGEQARFKRDHLRYYYTLFGEPAAEGKWGLSVEGHHLSLNFVVDGGHVVSHTPAFFGANPALVKSSVGVGPKAGTRVLAKEELLAFELVRSLTPDQHKQAVIAEKAPKEIRAAGEPQPPTDPPAGIAAKKLTTKQTDTLQALIEAYADNMPAKISQARLKEIEEAGLGNVYFAWAGAEKPGIGHYYRIQGPTFLVEFVNTQPDAAGNPANHIHSVWRNVHGDFNLPIK